MAETQKQSRAKTSVLLINLGTPSAPHPGAVGKYLREFLMDKEVLDIPSFWRWLLVNFIIVPFRKYRSAKAYQSIWTREGSPLLVYSQKLRDQLSRELGPDFDVELAMRYGEPELSSMVWRAANSRTDRVLFVPLYPQYALSSTKTVVDAIRNQWSKITTAQPAKYLESFFDDERFLSSLAKDVEEHRRNADFVLFSYHGLPERHVLKLDASRSQCLKIDSCCKNPGLRLRYCYRAQAYAMTQSVANKLSLKANEYDLSFQSRLGRDEWLKPDTETKIRELAQRGIKRVAVVCPSFVADCLETLEEIQIRAREIFQHAGGEDLWLIPCLNDREEWVRNLAGMIREPSARWQEI